MNKRHSGILWGGEKPPHINSYFGGCNHWRTSVRVGRYWVICSGSMGEFSVNRPPFPDFGIYLSTTWRDKLGKSWTNGAYLKRIALGRPYPALVTDWKDGGGAPAEELNQLVEICLSKMRKGKIIDIGCSAGHGRTGTLLACLMARVEHLTAKEAIVKTREQYCRWAIETLSQENSITHYVEIYGIKRRASMRGVGVVSHEKA